MDSRIFIFIFSVSLFLSSEDLSVSDFSDTIDLFKEFRFELILTTLNRLTVDLNELTVSGVLLNCFRGEANGTFMRDVIEDSEYSLLAADLISVFNRNIITLASIT